MARSKAYLFGGVEIRSLVVAPIQSPMGVIGIIEAINPMANSFDPDALLVMTGIGGLAGTTIQNAQLFEKLQAAHRRYRELFEDVRSFENLCLLHLGLISDLPRKSLPAIAKRVGANGKAPRFEIFTHGGRKPTGIENCKPRSQLDWSPCGSRSFARTSPTPKSTAATGRTGDPACPAPSSSVDGAGGAGAVRIASEIGCRNRPTSFVAGLKGRRDTTVHGPNRSEWWRREAHPDRTGREESCASW